ncbi:flagellar hook-length control protein FliK [Erwinia rhapontici]|uniref:flagellar hook-length control protein FliK n=1 Tax=Erwinia rhapontici TaxID=55212 RepID=UPI00105BE195|nr:flagellar hook-length control protein FliK [Erwinia rhapontici]NKG31855.1 flagellar hook-length control protein FliK [Erwinia rhapontici]TDS99774.1 flagellar hook-length control protein FliK [Erwinia rhapontici]
MITLPTAVTTTATTGSAKVSSTGDSTLDSTGSELTVGGETSQQGFLTLLGNRLLTLAQQGGTGVAVDGVEVAASDDGKEAKKPGISDLLAALDKPDTLTALLQPQQAKIATKDDVATDEKEAPAVTLSDSDLQALQALYAMLPNNAAVPVASATAKSSDLLTAGLNKSDKQSTLNALSAALGKVTTEEGDATSADAKNSNNALLVPVSAKSSDGTGTGKTSVNPGAVTLDPAFQQVMSNVSKDIDKENSSSAPTATITNNVISTASSLLTPTSTSMVSAPATPLLNSQLGSPEWQQALGQQILMFSRNGQQTAELHLHPQDLGSIQISLKLDNDQAQLSMVSNQSQVRAALEAALPQLRASLAESGINLGQSNVSSDAFQQGQSFAGQQEQQRNNNGSPFSLATENDSDVTPIAVPAALQARAAGSNAVDIFA